MSSFSPCQNYLDSDQEVSLAFILLGGRAFLLSVQHWWPVQFSIWNFDMVFVSSLLVYENLPELFSEAGRLSIMPEVNRNLDGDTKLFCFEIFG